MANSSRRNSGAAQAVRVVVAVLAALVIAFCGWSAYQYANGSDPLAFLGGNTLQTVEEGSSSSPSLELTSSSVTDDDVKGQIARLKYGSDDVSLSTGDVNVVLGKDGIWIENASDSAADDAITSTARRAAALASWAHEANVKVSHVTWIAEDMAGSVRIVVSYPVGRESKNEDTAQILAGCDGYRISGDAYAALGKDHGFKQEAGDAPVLPDDAEVTVIEQATSQGEVLVKTTESHSVLVAQSQAGSGSGSSSGSSSPAQADASITVSVTVDGSAVGAGSSSASVSIPAGATVYDALCATGVSINASNTQFGLYVSSIGGLAEKEHGGKSGWTYYVNGVMPMTSCANYKLAGGEKIVWRYVTGEQPLGIALIRLPNCAGILCGPGVFSYAAGGWFLYCANPARELGIL